MESCVATSFCSTRSYMVSILGLPLEVCSVVSRTRLFVVQQDANERSPNGDCELLALSTELIVMHRDLIHLANSRLEL